MACAPSRSWPSCFTTSRGASYRAGDLGVDLFFVLSGFLITTLLLQEWASTGTISIAHFYIRRVLRLFPVLLAFLLIFSAVVLGLRGSDFTRHPSVESVLINVSFALAYIYNWLGAAGNYRVPGMGHLWSLAVEEQYYLIWPPLLALMLRAKLTAPLVLALSFVVFVASASLPFWQTDRPYDRFFFGTDFRLHSLMAGSILGQFYVAGIIRRSSAQMPAYRTAQVAAALTLLLFMLAVDNKTPFLRAGGYTVVALASCVLVASSALDASAWLSRLLSAPILTYVGKRSYALYIWHYPFSFWLDSMSLVPELLAVAGLSLLAAELSYRLVERPALRLKSRFGSARASASDATHGVQYPQSRSAA